MPEIRRPSQSNLELLGKYDTPTVCNAIELFGVRPRNTGFMDGRLKCCFPEMPPVVGYASTATFRSADAPRSGDVYAGIGEQVEKLAEMGGPVVVVFQDLDDPAVGATFGEMMCMSLQKFGAKGIITSGAGRDLEQVQALGFQAFTGSTICAHGYCRREQLHVPVRVGGLMIYPGDLLHGDRNGVTTIPAEIDSEVAEACKELVAAEAILLNYLKQESVTAAGVKKAFAETGNRLQSFRQRFGRKSS